MSAMPLGPGMCPSWAARIFLSTLTLIVVLLAQTIVASKLPKITNQEFNIIVDIPFTITWADTVGPGVTIDLLELTGDKSIMFKESITSGTHRDNHHVWTPPSHLSATETYMFGILDEGTQDFKYSSTFSVIGGVVPDLRVRPINSTSNDTSSVVSSASDGVGLGAPTSTSSTSGLSTAKPSATEPPHGTGINNNSSSSDLSTGAKAGIGVGAAVGALLLITGLIYFVRSRRYNAAGGATGVDAASGEGMETKQAQPFPSELAAGGRDESPRLQRVELQG